MSPVLEEQNNTTIQLKQMKTYKMQCW